MRSLIIAAAMCVGVSANAAQKTPVEMPVACQQNITDGRILVDGTLLAHNARYTVKSYKPVRVEDGWSYGSCVIRLTNANP